ncbi:tigger transposable element-derived protein 1 [Trichonephila inaurata madagascariensis]|uniref:Tigger transposable element-derived protein 1 n=1 Tax=Trichonephila inaurata madagascariensis TaxID=2747483 RepID=A0A8X7C5Y5_9ARAC|nr:tigger transposable element-derived protein 1 [Trichonephila inaurata madagascariensis]
MFKQRVHFKNGRYEVEFPWKRDSNELSDNFNLAKRRLGSPMRKMQSDKMLYSEYCTVLRNYLDKGIIEKVTNRFTSTNDSVFYFPHQEITRNESLITKLRIMFDGSACERRVLKEEMGSEKSDEDIELPQATKKVLPLESERAKMLSVDPDPVAQPVTVREENGLSIVQLISVDEMYEEKEETPLHVIKDKAKGDVDPITREAASGDTKAEDEFPATLKTVIERGNYPPKLVFKIDETGLFGKRMPKRTFLSHEEKRAPGFKAAKDRLTLLLGGNASGDFKLKPLLIYHSKNQRVMKGISKSTLPVIWEF